jgi:hypothetical protein
MPLLDAFFERWAGTFEWVRPRGGSIGFPRLMARPPDRPLRRGSRPPKRESLIMPGTVFGDTGNHFRVGFGRTNMPEALARLDSYAERTLR